MGIARGPKIVTSGLVLALDAADRNSYDGNIVVYSVQCYSTYSVSLRSSNYTVQYSDDNSNWTTAFTGVMSNNSSCGIITGTGVNTSNLTAHKYWRYVEGSAVTLHHPRVSRIDFITPNGSVYNLITYTSDNCADSGTVAVGTVSKQFTPSTWRDLSGNSNKGTLTNGPTFSEGNMGSISFDGTNDYVNVPYNSILNTPNGATYEVWIKPTVATTGTFLNRGTSDSGATPDNPRFIAYSTGNLYFDWSSSGSDIYLETSTGVTLGRWNQVIGLATPSAQLRTFVNGRETSYSGRVNSLPSTLPNTSTALEIGAATWAPSYFNGGIAIVRLYNRVLSSSEILFNYNATKNRFGL